MRVLFFGDIVDEQAVNRLATDIPRWRQQHQIDLVFVAKEQQPAASVKFDLATGPLQLGAVIFDMTRGEITRLTDSSWPGIAKGRRMKAEG